MNGLNTTHFWGGYCWYLILSTDLKKIIELNKKNNGVCVPVKCLKCYNIMMLKGETRKPAVKKLQGQLRSWKLKRLALRESYFYFIVSVNTRELHKAC